METFPSFISERLQTVSVPARKLFALIVHEAYHGPLRPKPEGTATPPEILEACGLDVGEFYGLLAVLTAAGLIRVSNAYPFEEIRLSPEAAEVVRDSRGQKRDSVTLSSFRVPADQRYFEDYEAGRVYELGMVSVSQEEIIEFASRYDPQYFHTDPDQAKISRFGGIIASGWQTVSLAMRLYVDHYLSHVASLASPGTDEVRWPNPVRPGDTLTVRVAVLEARPSRSKADRGIVRARIEAVNQKGDLVLTMIVVSLLGRRQQP